MFQSVKPENKSSSILGPELEIHGDVKVSGSLLIYGKIFGNIHSNSAVRTAKGSVVKGNISANEATIGRSFINVSNDEIFLELSKSNHTISAILLITSQPAASEI